jgi:hypothetical protein
MVKLLKSENVTTSQPQLVGLSMANWLMFHGVVRKVGKAKRRRVAAGASLDFGRR